MPVGGGGGGSGGPLGDDNNDMAAAGGNNNDNNNDNNNNNNNNELPSSRPSSAASSSSVIQRHATEMLPRSPTSPVTTRSRSPSTGGTGGGSENTISSRGRSTSPSTMRIQFLGLRNLIPGDKFNEYVLGRSLKADVTAQKLTENNNNVGNTSAATTLAATTTTVADDEEQIQQQQLRRREDAKLKRNDYVHAMVSNRHCRIYCLLENVNTHNDTNNINSNANNDDGQSSSQTSLLSSSFTPPPPDMEVFVEDTSGNGTLINGTTLLRKYERRRLHTGDVICLLNPKLLSKKIRSITERKAYMSQYSYVFVNLYEQEARHGWGITTSTTSTTNTAEKIMTRGRMKTRSGGDSSIASPTPPLSSSTTKKMGTAAVNVRATKCHSIKNNNNSDEGGGDGTTKKYTAAATATLSGATSSLGSFLNNQKSKYNPTDNNSNAHHPRGSGLSTHRTTTTTTTTVRERRIEEDYDLRDLLGTGTCGEVRRAIHRRTGDERAVKIIAITGRKNGKNATNNNNNILMSCDNLTAIQAEAEILRSLDHPYIVKLFDTYISHAKGTIYLVMELIRGGDLFDRIVDKRDGRYTEIQARRLFRRILTAVHYLHEDCDIVHRDLKPENILVVDRRSDVNIKLTDFGLAKNMTAEGLKTFCGTPQYFAPEVFRRSHTVKGNGRYGKEIDCWSIGVILFILLSGSPPFDVSAGFDSVANAEIVFYDDQWRLVTLEARDLLMRLLEKDPRKRLSVKDACDHAWVLMDDGDTHCHPLHDPLVVSLTTTRIKSEDSSSTLADKATATANLSDKSVTKSARVDENKRQASIWPTSGQSHDDTGTITNVIQESLQTLSQQLSPTTSPIGKRQLFVTTFGAPKKMTKKDLETIKSAGNTLPTPVINNESRPTKKIPALAPTTKKKKEKKQSTLFPSTGVGGVKQQQQRQQNKIAPNASSQLPDIENRNNKRKLRTSTVTPPGGGTEQQNCGLVFRLKHGGKYISPESRQTAASSTTTIADESKKKAELSEDELGDFSDDNGDIDNSFTAIAAPAESWETKKPLEKYLHKKRRIDSIESTASDSTKSISQMSSTVEIEPEKKQCTVPNNNNNTSKNKDRKFKQTFLFGRTPLNHDTSEELINLPEPADVVNSTLNNDQPSESGESGGEIIRQSQLVTESKENGVTVNTTTNATLKGKQRSITSWFQPR